MRTNDVVEFTRDGKKTFGTLRLFDDQYAVVEFTINGLKYCKKLRKSDLSLAQELSFRDVCSAAQETATEFRQKAISSNSYLVAAASTALDSVRALTSLHSSSTAATTQANGHRQPKKDIEKSRQNARK